MRFILGFRKYFLSLICIDTGNNAFFLDSLLTGTSCKYIIISFSKDFGLWYRSEERVVGFSLGFVSFYLARDKELVFREKY